MIHRAWLQKHPTPDAQAGEFHWYPASAELEALRASFVERLPNAPAGCVLWRIAPGEVAWGQTFTAVAPVDNRRYTGLALVIATGDEPTADLLAAIVPPSPTPYTATTTAAATATAAAAGLPPDLAGIVRALLSGAPAHVGDPAAPDLPGLVASVERELPASVHAVARTGTFLPGAKPRAGDRVAELAAAAIATPRSHAATTWRLARSLATASRTVDEVFALAERDDPAFRTTLNAWGRDRLDAPLSVDELADRLALRVLAALVAERDPAHVIAEARWYALLPAARRDALLAALATRAPLLEELAHA